MGHVLKRALVAAVPCLLVLSGCGVAGTEFNPGVAARVGDETVSTNAVDELTTDYCHAIKGQLAGRVPLSSYRVGIAALLGWKEAATQLAEGYDIKPGKDYEAQVVSFQKQADDLKMSDEDAKAFVEVQVTQSYVYDLLTQIGLIELTAEGEKDPTLDFQQARGQDELEKWIDENGVEFDPKYGLTMTDGVPASADTDLSFVEGDLAKSATKVDDQGNPDASYIASLPKSSTCG